MKITENMIAVFNQTLENLDCSFRLKMESGTCGNTQCKIVPSNDKFIQSSIINLTEEFYKELEKFFNERGIELSYNNDKSKFWSRDGWKDIIENIK